MISKLMMTAAFAATQVAAKNEFMLAMGNIMNKIKANGVEGVSDSVEEIAAEVQENVALNASVNAFGFEYDVAYPGVATSDQIQTMDTNDSAEVSTAVYQDSDTWTTYATDLNNSSYFSYASLFSDNVFLAEINFATEGSEWLICIGDDGTYGAMCLFYGL